jgi:hypothetical protein
VETGVCWSGDSLALRRPGFCNALHADVLFLRDSGGDWGLGPSLRLGTARFDDVRLDGGVSLLVPVFQSFPLVLEAGPHLRNFEQAGVFGSVFFGLRSFNHYGHYDMATGISLLLRSRYTLRHLAHRARRRGVARPAVLGSRECAALSTAPKWRKAPCRSTTPSRAHRASSTKSQFEKKIASISFFTSSSVCLRAMAISFTISVRAVSSMRRSPNESCLFAFRRYRSRSTSATS